MSLTIKTDRQLTDEEHKLLSSKVEALTSTMAQVGVAKIEVDDASAHGKRAKVELLD
jgi:hypothetical protein